MFKIGDISNNIDEILHALDIPIDSDDDNCDNFLSDDELLEELEGLNVFYTTRITS